MKSLRLVSAVAVSAFLFACSNGTGNPGSAEGDVSAVEKSDGAVAQSAKQPAPEAESGSTESEALDEGIAETEIPASSSSEEASSSDTGYSWTEEEISDFLEEFNISPADTARHDPDSVGVWHFYDPRGTHDNPDFAYGEMTDPRDGMVYKTTTIGGQVWMAENLNYFDIEGAPSAVKNDWCYWDKPENCESAGRLYTWNVAQRICPEGWRLPTKSDWESLLQEVGADSLNEILWKGSSKLKSKSGASRGHEVYYQHPGRVYLSRLLFPHVGCYGSRRRCCGFPGLPHVLGLQQRQCHREYGEKDQWTFGPLRKGITAIGNKDWMRLV